MWFFSQVAGMLQFGVLSRICVHKDNDWIAPVASLLWRTQLPHHLSYGVFWLKLQSSGLQRVCMGCPFLTSFTHFFPTVFLSDLIMKHKLDWVLTWVCGRETDRQWLRWFWLETNSYSFCVNPIFAALLLSAYYPVFFLKSVGKVPKTAHLCPFQGWLIWLPLPTSLSVLVYRQAKANSIFQLILQYPKS